MEKWTAKKLAVDALAIALVCVATMVIQIPIPLGYMHLGNCCILLVSVYFGNVTGMLAGGVGSCLADLLSGYPQWILPTLIIKGIMGLAIAVIAYRKEEEIHMFRVRTFLGAAAGIVIMIVGYTAAGCILYGSVASGLAQSPGLTTEGIIGLLRFYVIGLAFEKAKVSQLIRRFA
ncbi:MAG: ECF transporter S component [Firmicutes bacterium]|nr:ECF transporter S component [Bacillota bacterium]